MIHFENATRKYGRKVAVSDLNLRIEPGELFAFLGPNGAGKTTAIKMLVGLLHPSSGRVSVCGCDTARQTREATRHLGFIPDEAYLYDKLTGREFLQFVAEMRGMSRRQAADGIEEQCELFELEGFVDELTESYSHGMRQRLVFAAALVHDPPALVLDEPMVGLDPRSVRLVKDLLRRRAEAGKTVFMSTHTLALAEEIADRIGIIDHGRLLFVGTLDELRRARSDRQESLEHLFLELTNGNGAAGELTGAAPASSD